MIMKSPKLGWLTSLVLVALLFTAPALAQARQTNNAEPAENGKKRVFVFDGGNPIDFIIALDKHFRTRLVQILTLPDLLRRTEVPKLRVAAEDPREVLSLYNRLESPTLGQWRFEPTNAPETLGTNLNALLLVPDKSIMAAKTDRTGLRVKALALAGIPEKKWDSLLRDVNEARDAGREAAREMGGGDASFAGSCRFQRDSKVLIVSGAEGYIEMVESLLSAHRLNAEIETRPGVSKAASEETK
jgi:hypothetical protein